MADLKPRLIQLLDMSRLFQQRLLADLSPAERSASGTWEEWSIKDELAHVIAWQLNTLARIAALMHAEPMPDFDDNEAINRAIYQTNRDRTLADILADGHQVLADFDKIIESYSDEELDQPARFGVQQKHSLAEMIIGNGFEHPVLHYSNYYLHRGDLAKAAEIQETSVAALRDMPAWYGAARYNLACFYALSGQIDRALAELREALRLRPDLRDWSKQDADLTALRAYMAYQAL